MMTHGALTLAELLADICHVSKVNVRDVCGKGRAAHLVKVRRVFVRWALEQTTNKSAIARTICRTPSSIHHLMNPERSHQNYLARKARLYPLGLSPDDKMPWNAA